MGDCMQTKNSIECKDDARCRNGYDSEVLTLYRHCTKPRRSTRAIPALHTSNAAARNVLVCCGSTRPPDAPTLRGDRCSACGGSQTQVVSAL